MQQHLGRPTPARTRGLATFAALAGTLIVSLLGAVGASAVTADATSLRAVTVNQTLAQQLAANPTGGVTAIVTTWGRDGLDDVERLGVTAAKLRVLPMIITAALTQAQLDELRRSPAVRSVWAEHEYDLSMEESTWITKAPYVWSTSTPPGGPKGCGLKFEQRVNATPPTLGLAGRVKATVTLPTFTANQRIVVHIDPVFVESQTVTFIYYDSENPCAVGATGRRDSLVRMPVLSGGGGGQTESTPTPENQPLSPALRIAWEKLNPAPTRDELRKSTDPLVPYVRQVKLKVDRLYGPQYLEYALEGQSPTLSEDGEQQCPVGVPLGHVRARRRDVHGLPGPVHARPRPASALRPLLHAGHRLDEGR